MNIESCPSPSSSSEREFSSEFLRQLPDQALLVPRVLDRWEGRSSLHLASNGRGDQYVLLRLYAPSAVSGKSAEFFLYMGKLDELQLQFVDRLVAEHRAKRIPSGPERIKDCQPDLIGIVGIWRDTLRVATWSAARAGYSFRGYALHKCKTRVLPSVQLPPPPELRISPFPSSAKTFEHLQKILMHIREKSEGDPLKTLDDALFVLDALCGWIERLLSGALLFSCYECATAMLEYGQCRHLTVDERRAMTRCAKTRAIRLAIGKSRTKIAGKIATRGTAK